MADDDVIKRRLAELKNEYETGQKQLSVLERRVVELRSMLARIEGAIKVLEEELAEKGPR
jgi:chromosome segregation ATPase